MSSMSWNQVLISAQGDGSALSAAAAASALPGQAKLPFGGCVLKIGDVIKVRSQGRISCVVTTPGTARYDVRFGTPVVFDSLAMNLNVVAQTNQPWVLDLELTCRSVGSGTAATFMGLGSWVSAAAVGSPAPTAGGSGIFALPYNTAPVVGAGFDSTVTNVIDHFFTQTVATGAMTLHTYSLALTT